jgi:hypothetical protein
MQQPYRNLYFEGKVLRVSKMTWQEILDYSGSSNIFLWPRAFDLTSPRAFDLTSPRAFDLTSPLLLIWHHHYFWFDITTTFDLTSPLLLIWHHHYFWFDITTTFDLTLPHHYFWYDITTTFAFIFYVEVFLSYCTDTTSWRTDGKIECPRRLKAVT